MVDMERIQRCVEQVQAYRSSGMKAQDWAQANGLSLGTLNGWCGHYCRWQIKLGGGAEAAAAPGYKTKPTGFVAARLAPQAQPVQASTVRIDVSGAAGLTLHWPISGARELAALLREMGP